MSLHRLSKHLRRFCGPVHARDPQTVDVAGRPYLVAGCGPWHSDRGDDDHTAIWLRDFVQAVPHVDIAGEDQAQPRAPRWTRRALPPLVGDFVGRESELRDALRTASTATEGAVFVLHGM